LVKLLVSTGSTELRTRLGMSRVRSYSSGKIRAMVRPVRSALVRSVLVLLCLWLGCNGLWSPFLEYRDGSDGSTSENPDAPMPPVCTPPSGPGVCSCDSWCWQNPLPQGMRLVRIWGADPSNVWAVGDGGTIVKWNGSAWSAQSSSTSQNLSGVWGSDASNVWAVGWFGTIVKWNGSAWSVQSSSTSQTLVGVWGSDTSNVWAVGDGGTIVKWNGSAWSAQSSGSAYSLLGVWGTAKQIWVVGVGGAILSRLL
jgi:hypothetical protein